MSRICFANDRTASNGESAPAPLARNELAELLSAMRWQRECGDFSTLVPVDAYGEFREIAEEHNRILLRVGAEIRAREEAMESAQRATEKYRSIFENSAEGIFQTSLEGRYLCVNPALARIYGYVSPEQLMDGLRNIGGELYVDPDRRRQFQQALERQDTVENFESRVNRCDGKVIWISENARVIRNEQGRPLYYEGTVVDITQRKEQARLVLEAQERAEQANRAKSAFLANMSHEIRTPMTAILGHADILLQRNLDSECTEALAVMKRNGEHLLEIINSILDLSKIEAGRLTLEAIACDVCATIADVASLMRVRAAAKRLSLSVEFCGPIPECIISDPTRLRQILINLVGNAIKFTNSGQVQLRVGLSEGPGASLRFEVIDTGIGMTAEQLGRIFQPFVQADASMTRLFGGTGLGLNIAHRLAEMLGGTLSAASTSGKGSTFTLTLPTAASTKMRMLAAPSEAFEIAGRIEQYACSESTNVPLTGRRILLAEDGEDNQRLISFHLAKTGAEVDIAENGRIAMEMLQAAAAGGRPFDLLLSDMQMPEMDGYTLAKMVRASGSRIPIVALTAHAMAEDRQKCLDAGCNDYASKPINKAALISTCRHWMVTSGNALP